MKILIFHTYNQGYLSSFFHELSVKLIQKGCKVVGFSWKASVSEQYIDGVKIIVTKKKGYITNYRKVYRIIKKEKPDVVLSNFSYVNPALLFGRLLGVKKNMVWFHSLNEQMTASRRNIFIKKHFLKLADIVIANSYLTQNELCEFYEVPTTKIHAIPFWSTILEQKMEPSDLKFITEKNTVKIGCPGRMVTHKNQKIIIDTLSELINSSKTNFHLYFAGTGEELTNLVNQVEELNLTHKVTFLKHLSANDMLHFYNSMDVVVLPSLHEAFGLVFIEAIALGTPVIVSSQFGALSFIEQKHADFKKITFNPLCPKDLLDKLLPYINHQGLPKEIFKQLYASNFDKEVIFKKILNIIKTA
ncbi:glycosyltransferase family 4 protein [Xanthomarina gelatinilytica]